MKTLKILLAIVAVTSLSSCHFDLRFGQVNGNGNVITEERAVGNFKAVHASEGMDVYITEGTENKVVVEADENLMEIIETYVEGNTLRIGTEKSIGHSKSKKVHVTYTQLEALDASSGADLFSNSVVTSEVLSLETSSGADMEVEIMANEVYMNSSSGSDLKVSGKARHVVADASSGSDIKARQLETISCKADASSGASVSVTVKDVIDAQASSGGDVRYYGNPSDVSVRDGVSGSVRKM